MNVGDKGPFPVFLRQSANPPFGIAAGPLQVVNTSQDPWTFAFNNQATYSNIVILMLAWYNGNVISVSSVTYGGDAMALLDSQLTSADNIRMSIYYKLSALTGSNNVVVDFSGSAAEVAAVVSAWNTVHQGTPFGAVAKDAQDSAAPSLTIASAVGEIPIAAVTTYGRTFDVEGGTRIEFADAAGGSTDCLGSRAVGAAPNVTIAHTLNSGNRWAMVGASLKPAA